MNGFYRRSLPSPPAVDFLSDVGKQLFVEAIQDGTMEGFYSLSSYFQTQPEPTFCGLTTLSMVLNALSIDPCRKWKGPWRWFDESMLDFCEPLEKIKARGISFGTLECMAHCAGAKVEAFRASRSSIDDFRKHVIKCSTSDQCHVISSYHRAALKQTGAGHYSPIGGYHVGKDMALILDVARFKYPPHWVPLTLLWEGMNYVVESTRQTRGFMLISRPHREPGMLYTLNCNHESWISTAKFLINDVPLLLQSEDVKNIHKVLSLIVASLPYNFEEFIKWFAEIRRREAEAASLSTEEKARLAVKEEVLKQVQEAGLFNHVASFFSSSCDGDIFTEHCCQETCMKCCEAEDDKRIMPVCETVMNGDSDQGVGVMIPLSPQKLHCTCNDPRKYIKMYPATTDVLTVLLLSLPSVTWSGIKDDRLLREIDGLVSIENLPVLLQEEVLHIRKQLHLLKKCQEGKVDDDLGSPFA